MVSLPVAPHRTSTVQSWYSRGRVHHTTQNAGGDSHQLERRDGRRAAESLRPYERRPLSRPPRSRPPTRPVATACTVVPDEPAVLPTVAVACAAPQPPAGRPRRTPHAGKPVSARALSVPARLAGCLAAASITRLKTPVVTRGNR